MVRACEESHALASAVVVSCLSFSVLLLLCFAFASAVCCFYNRIWQQLVTQLMQYMPLSLVTTDRKARLFLQARAAGESVLIILGFEVLAMAILNNVNNVNDFDFV